MSQDLTAFISDDMGAAFISGEEAAKLVLCPDADRTHESAFWLGFLNGLMRKGVHRALRDGGAVLSCEQVETR